MNEVYEEIEKLDRVFRIFKLMQDYQIPDKDQAFVLTGSMKELSLDKR